MQHSKDESQTQPSNNSLASDSIESGHEFQNETIDNAEGRPQEECGVFGIYAPGVDVARRAFFGIFALQHRGQEAAGFAVVDCYVFIL